MVISLSTIFIAIALNIVSSLSFAKTGRDDRARGSLLGLAFGDALGAPTESFSAKEIEAIYGVYNGLPTDLPFAKILQIRGEANYRRSRIPGSTTDDTQQSLALVLSILLNPQWGDGGIKFFAQLLVEGSSAGAWRGIGKMFVSAVAKLSQGSNYKHSGAFSAGIGAAMRVGPVAGIGTIAEEVLADAVITTSLSTHADLRAAALSYAVFKLNRYFIDGKQASEARALLPAAVAAVEHKLLQMKDWRIDTSDPHSVSSVLTSIFAKSTANDTLETLTSLVVSLAEPYVDPKFANGIHANNPFVLLGGIHAIILAMQDSAPPMAVLKYISNLGDDTDTVAAISGSILGARFGSAWIPTDQLMDHARLSTYADALISTIPPESRENYLKRETELTVLESDFQQSLPLRPGDCSGGFSEGS